jgi:hypothetical protein
VTSTMGGIEDEFARAAELALRVADGPEALDTLGWWQLLADLTDLESRTAVFAFFRAQGHELASSNALGALTARPYLELLGDVTAPVVATVACDSPRRGHVAVVVGDPTGRLLLVDRPGSGVVLFEPGEVELRPIEVPGRLVLHEVAIDDGAQWRPVIDEGAAVPARDRATFLGRVAIGLEILGAAGGALALAVEHARAREQFGQPIATFQAVRHLLAWGTTDCTAVERVASEAVRLDTAAPARWGDITKAIAGRNGRRVCERALQVLGAIGFTAEHGHHHFHSRVLALDALLGTSAALTRDLGRWRREEPGSPSAPSALLLAR